MLAPTKKIPVPGAEFEVHLVTLGSDQDCISHYTRLLSADERERIGRFRFEHEAWRFIIARGTLRLLLGEKLGMSPQSVKFTYTDKGKPQLDHVTDITFNTSHSHQRIVHALACAHDVGVDIEYIHRKINHEALAEHCFTKSEYAWFRTIPVLEQKIAFLSCWTRKEALAKAIGTGLAMRFDGIEVHPECSTSACCIDKHMLYTLDVGEAYVAALAVAEVRKRIHYWS